MESKRRGKILIVDEEKGIRDLFARTLEPAGYDVVAVADPDEGAERAKQIEPDIVYLGLLFPESNGLKVSKSIHSVERLKELPIVVTISYQGELDPKYTRTIGIVDVLVRPLKPADILAMTARLMGEEIPFEGGGPAGVSGEISEEVPGTVEEAGLSLAGSGGEGVSEESELPVESEEKEMVEATGEIEEADRRPDQTMEPTAGEERGFRDFVAEEKESHEDWVPPDGRTEETGGQEHGFPAGEYRPPGNVEEEEKSAEEADFETPPETGKRPTGKYILFAVLILLVAVAVFAAFQAGILPGGSREGKTAALVVEKAPSGKEVAREVARPGKAGNSDKTEDTEARKENRKAEKVLNASPSPGERKARQGTKRAGKLPLRRGAKVLNDGLKEPRILRGQQKEIYSVQVGAFEKESNAVSFAGKLKKRGYDAFVEKSAGSGLHRVLIGRFGDQKKALQQSQVLLRKDGIKSVVYRH